MSNRRTGLCPSPAAALLTLALGGCVAQPAPPPAGPQFDGAYVGQTQLLRGGGFVCGQPDLPRELIVRNGRLLYPFQVDPPSGMTQVPVQIAADGSVQGGTRYGVFEPMMRRDYRTELMTVAGRVAGNTLDITESDHRCTRRSLLQRR